MDQLKKKWHRYHYKNLTYLAIRLIVSLLLLKNSFFQSILLQLGNFGYIGAFIGGILFVSTFTISIGAVILLTLTKYLHPVEIGLIAGLGAVITNLIIFKLIKNNELTEEIKHFFNYFGGDKVSHLLHSKYFSWSLPVIGALIIASPLPDELGVSLIGISRMQTSKFVIMSFFLNSIGIFLAVSAGTLIKFSL